MQSHKVDLILVGLPECIGFIIDLLELYVKLEDFLFLPGLDFADFGVIIYLKAVNLLVAHATKYLVMYFIDYVPLNLCLVELMCGPFMQLG